MDPEHHLVNVALDVGAAAQGLEELIATGFPRRMMFTGSPRSTSWMRPGRSFRASAIE